MKKIFINACIFTCEEKDFQNGYMLVENGIVIDIGDMSDCPEVTCTEIIDIAGERVYPGFIDAHCHLGLLEDGLDFEGDDLNESTDPITPQLRGLDGVNPQDRCFAEALSAGVTCVCTGPGSANPIGGQMAVIKTFGNCIDDMVVKAPVAIKCAFGENPKRVYNGKHQTPITRMGSASLIRQALEKAKRYMQKTNPDYDEKLEALVPVLKGELPLHCHAHRADDIFTAIRIANEFSVKVVIVHATEGYIVASELKEKNVELILGPVLGDRSKPELKNAELKAMAQLEKNDIFPALCTDHTVIPIQYLPICAGLCKREGLTERTALLSITKRPAEILGVADMLGSLAVGKSADFSVYNKSPLSLEGKCLKTYINGEQVF